MGTGQEEKIMADAVQFSRGLKATIAEHIKLFGNIRKLLRPADPDVWAEFYEHATGAAFRHTQVSSHAFETPGHEQSFVATTAKPSKAKKTQKPQFSQFKRTWVPEDK